MALVLMIEDNPNDTKLVQLTLGSSFHFLYVETLAEAYKAVELARPDVFLLDLKLPDCQGMESLDRLVKDFPKIPVVVWSGADSAAEAVRHGAEDFILKGRELKAVEDALAAAIKRHAFTEVRRDIQTLQKMIENDKK